MLRGFTHDVENLQITLLDNVLCNWKKEVLDPSMKVEEAWLKVKQATLRANEGTDVLLELINKSLTSVFCVIRNNETITSQQKIPPRLFKILEVFFLEKRIWQIK